VLIGLAAKNAILIVEFARQNEEHGEDRFQAATEAARVRLRPILMTSFAFILGVLPLVIATGAGAEMRQSLGTAVFYGMIGVTVFERGETFNPGTDPIVRVQARRLRSKLSLYYETDGRADTVRIELPCGGYVPVFHFRTAAEHMRSLRPLDDATVETRRSLVVLPFVNIGPDANERFSDGLTEELIHGSKATDLRVLARTSSFHFKGKTTTFAASAYAR
jgi:hypothetical protein